MWRSWRSLASAECCENRLAHFSDSTVAVSRWAGSLHKLHKQ
jgi:hypothetical protein